MDKRQRSDRILEGTQASEIMCLKDQHPRRQEDLWEGQCRRLLHQHSLKFALCLQMIHDQLHPEAVEEWLVAVKHQGDCNLQQSRRPGRIQGRLSCGVKKGHFDLADPWKQLPCVLRAAC